MIPVNNKVLLECDPFQKEQALIGENLFRCANLFETNYRYKSPTIAKVVEGNQYLLEGDVLLCHHNLFYQPSPYFIQDNLFSVPFSKVLFAKILSDGSLQAICGNLLGNKIVKETFLPLPPERQEFYNDRFIINDAGWTRFKKGQTIYARPSSCYDIIYHLNGVQKSVTKISEDMIIGVKT